MKQKNTNKLVIVINGRGGVGKDTLCASLRTIYSVTNISAITPIKEIAKTYGWNGEKDERSRRFLANLKRVFADYNDLPNHYLSQEYRKFIASDAEILCVHIREKDQIEKFIAEVTVPCVTILVKRDTESYTQGYGNDADDGVEYFCYDYEFDNNASIKESSDAFRSLIKEIFLKSQKNTDSSVEESNA